MAFLDLVLSLVANQLLAPSGGVQDRDEGINASDGGNVSDDEKIT